MKDNHIIYSGILDVDLFETPSSTIQNLHAHGIKVIRYFSAGLLKIGGQIITSSPPVTRVVDSRSGRKKTNDVGLDGFTNTNSLGSTAADTALLMRALAVEAVKHGMSTGLEIAQSTIASVELVVHLAMDEEWSARRSRKTAVSKTNSSPRNQGSMSSVSRSTPETECAATMMDIKA
ncbi:H(+)/Cl(-) exchange transporter 3 [Venturia nashicola]|uniref:H(+)/Cl(-) exchange transporter 3 n=1 Tax=Venturia nashicola TaxID=86259 RepID=A0A4Z1P4A3_9PEZI|nr:H(+)/Cl(-) exchange transporter 3 [Venturia nashicola]TLD21014.1 H(+)/Cl(-) exchange transporter 3 [Venturia nashicola]